MSKPTNYTPEYKKEIIRLVTEQKKTVSEVARGIGVSDTTIREWIKNILNTERMLFPGKVILNRRTKNTEIYIEKLKI